jgi:ATP-dependent helicase HrpA
VLTAFADMAMARRAHPQGVKALLMRHLSGDIKFLRKNLNLPYECDPYCRYFGGRPALEEQLLDSVLDAHLARDIRTGAEFDTLLEELHTRGIAAWGQERRAGVIEVLKAYQAARMQLADLVGSHPANAPLHALIERLRADMQRLVPDRFVALYDDARLKLMPRYIKAFGLRAARAAVDLEKDRIKSVRVKPHEERLEHLIRSLPPHAGAEKRRAIEDFFWLLEEFKISVYAPEIKTVRPVSEKRLETALKEIEEMI